MSKPRPQPLALVLLLFAWLLAPVALAAKADPHLRADLAPAIDYAKRNKGRSVLIQRGDRILLEDYHNGGSRRTPNYLASGTKSFWGIAVAAMIEDGIVASFDEPVADTLDEWRDDPAKRRIRVRDLLSLTSGLSEDMKSIGGTREGVADKYAAAVALPAAVEPGKRFRYGPSHFYALGEFMKRKLEPRGHHWPI